MDNNIRSAGKAKNAYKDTVRCLSCKRTHSKCEYHETDWRCKSCVEKIRPCNVRVRARGDTITGGDSTEYTTTVLVLVGLLNLCRSQFDQISSIIFPFPCVNSTNHTTTFVSKSWKLSKSLQLLASRIRIQMNALDSMAQYLLQSQCAMAAGAFIRQLHQNLAYHPDRSFEELSTANAVDISRCVLNIWNRIQGNSVQAQPCGVSLHQRVEQYRKTEWNLTHIMQFQYFGIAPAFAAQQAGFVQIHNPLPASHIAYWNGDPEAALELWRQSPNHIDIVGRTFAHILAENGDLEMMREIYRVNPGALRYARSDLRGLNVLALTILSQSQDCFNFMLEVSPDMPFDTDVGVPLLDLGLASGIKDIVDKLIQINFASPPFTKDMAKAIELGRADLGNSFLPWLKRATYVSQSEIHKLAHRADKMARELDQCAEFAWGQGWHESETDLRTRHDMMVELWCDLQHIRVVPAVVQDATRSLTTMQIPDDDGLL